MDKISQVLGTETGMELATRPRSEDQFLGKTESDIELARKNLVELMEQGMEVVPDMLDQCQTLQDAKMYQAAAQFMSALSEMTSKLSKINAPLKPAKGSEVATVPQPSNVTTNNNVFVGTTEDYIAMVRAQKQKEESVVSSQ